MNEIYRGLLVRTGTPPTAPEVAEAIWLGAYGYAQARSPDPDDLATARHAAARLAVRASPLAGPCRTRSVVPVMSGHRPEPPRFTPPQPSLEEVRYLRTEDLPTRYFGVPPTPVPPVRTVRVAALPDALALGRALRPLRIRRDGREPVVVDELATARRIMEERRWEPVLRPAPMRWPDLALVVDGAPTMALWQPLIRQFRALLERLGAFRELRCWQLSARAQPGGATTSVTVRPWGAARSAQGISAQGISAQGISAPGMPVDRLVDPAGRRLVLVLTDGVDPAWGDGRYARILGRLGRRGPTAVLSVVPPRLWQSTGIRTCWADVRAAEALQPNARWRRLVEGRETAEAETAEAETEMDGVPIPVVELQPQRVEWLAETLGGHATWAPLNLLDARRHVTSGRPASAATPFDQVQAFRTRSSPAAYALMTHLSAYELELSTMRRVMLALGDAGPLQLAEVLHSELIEPVGPDGEPARYRFRDERVRAELSSRLNPASLVTMRGLVERLPGAPIAPVPAEHLALDTGITVPPAVRAAFRTYLPADRDVVVVDVRTCRPGADEAAWVRAAVRAAAGGILHLTHADALASRRTAVRAIAAHLRRGRPPVVLMGSRLKKLFEAWPELGALIPASRHVRLPNGLRDRAYAMIIGMLRHDGIRSSESFEDALWSVLRVVNDHPQVHRDPLYFAQRVRRDLHARWQLRTGAGRGHALMPDDIPAIHPHLEVPS